MSTAENHAEETATSLLQRAPSAVFTTVYGAVLVAVVVLGVILLSIEATTTPIPATLPRPERPLLAPPADRDNVESSIRPYLITDIRSTRTFTGVTLVGTMTDQAVANTEEFAGHVARLLQQNCLDNLTLTTTDNMRVNFWGFCYTALPEDTIEYYLDTALTTGAQHVSFKFFPGRPTEYSTTILWEEKTDARAAQIASTFEKLALREGVDSLLLMSYGPETVYTGDHVKDRPYTEKQSPTGARFKEKWQIPDPAL